MAAGAAGIAGIAYYERTGQDPVYAAANAVASAADAIFVPGYQAFKANFVSPESFPASAAQYVGVEGSVGATVGDILDFVKNSASGLYDGLKDLIALHSSSPIFNEPIYNPGDIFAFNENIYQIINGTWSYLGTKWLSDLTSTYGIIEINTGFDSYDYYYGYSNGSAILIRRNPVTTQTWRTGLIVLDPSFTPTIIPEPGAVAYQPLSESLKNPNHTISEEIKDVVKQLPEGEKITSPDPAPQTVPAPAPSPITNPQIQNFFITNTTNVRGINLDYIKNGGDSVLGTAITDLTKAQEEEAQKETEETFSPITANPFETPYTPGPDAAPDETPEGTPSNSSFDLSTRFTTFLANVKTSGLFSFSSNFFNSLPGGGSPVYQIHGGSTFGNHTIDLSDTMSTGLAILKSILLACFGFLSIRAIIMKR